MEEISKEACDITGNETLEETKHKNIYLSFQTMAIFRMTMNDGTHPEKSLNSSPIEADLR